MLQQREKEKENSDLKKQPMHTIQKQIKNQLLALPPICIQTLSSSASMDHLELMDSNAPTMPLSDTPLPLQRQQHSSVVTTLTHTLRSETEGLKTPNWNGLQSPLSFHYCTFFVL